MTFSKGTVKKTVAVQTCLKCTPEYKVALKTVLRERAVILLSPPTADVDTTKRRRQYMPIKDKGYPTNDTYQDSGCQWKE